MKSIPVEARFFEGAVSLEQENGRIRPWRIPVGERDLFMPSQADLLKVARECAGVRLRVETDAQTVVLSFDPLDSDPSHSTHTLDMTIGPEWFQPVSVPRGETVARFESLPSGNKVVEIWLPHDAGMAVRGLSVDDGASVVVAPDPRPRWVTYGSSLTHCRRAHSPARTWPALVARRAGFHLTSLGYAGNCCLETAMGLMIRDLPADLITLKLGINCIHGRLSDRTYGPAVMGLVRIIRERHPRTPLALISPIAYPPHERIPSAVGYTIEGMRADLAEVAERLRKHGDPALYDFSGLLLFDEEEIAAYSTDQCHPNGDGIELMAEHFLARILPGLGAPAGMGSAGDAPGAP